MEDEEKGHEEGFEVAFILTVVLEEDEKFGRERTRTIKVYVCLSLPVKVGTPSLEFDLVRVLTDDFVHYSVLPKFIL